mmetsp:Transcript_374/g.319  ORF Transcript_374/g.319 Transcript_374/m.319 type:complete len:109 (+) Transcript_374:353-679(+)
MRNNGATDTHDSTLNKLSALAQPTQTRAILRVVNHIDNVKLITTKNNLLAQLKSYYGHLKDKILEIEGTDNPHHIPYFGSANRTGPNASIHATNTHKEKLSGQGALHY